MPVITVRSGAAPAALEDATNKGVTRQIAGDCFLFKIPDVARFLLAGGRDAAGVDVTGYSVLAKIAEIAEIPCFV